MCSIKDNWDLRLAYLGDWRRFTGARARTFGQPSILLLSFARCNGGRKLTLDRRNQRMISPLDKNDGTYR